MRHWGWRPLICLVFISVLVVTLTSCADAPTPTRTASPTLSPLPTLFVRSRATLTPTPSPGLLLQVEHSSTTSTASQITPVSTSTYAELFTSTPLAMLITPPDCYETPPGAVLCMGSIKNEQRSPVVRVVVAVDLFSRDGRLVRTIETLLPQQVLLPGESAPYSVLFEPEPGRSVGDAFGEVGATLRRADATVTTDAPPEVAVQLDNIMLKAERYVLTVVVTNSSISRLEALRVVATLYDEAGRVNGYRVTLTGPLDRGESTTLEMEILPQSPPQVVDVMPRYTLHAEAVR
ncbi:MAG: FxLYD domain-containing protein [bacterium]|nr:FxLYD domain-containing protein [bacterium]